MQLREGILYEKLEDGRSKCDVCNWRCVMRPGAQGVCRVRRNIDGILHINNYGLVSSANADPVEKKPMAHFFPNTWVFSLGSLGCNFHCKHCQNWEISFSNPEEGAQMAQYLSPEAAIALTRRYGCSGISWTYNEPSIWLEYTIDCAKLAKEQGLYTVYVTNGFSTPEALDAIGPYLDAFRVDIKGFTDTFYRDMAKVSPKWHEILEVTKRAKHKWGMHVEVITNVIPTMNDRDEHLRDIAVWIRDNLGDLTPWHVTGFHPDNRLLHIPATPLSTLVRGCEIGKQVGLKFVYIGNVVGHPYENTYCYSCQKLIVERLGYRTRVIGLDGSRCRYCGAELNFRTNLNQRKMPASVG